MCTVNHLTKPDASGEETAKYLYIPWSHQRKPAMQGISVILSGLISDVFASVMGEQGRIPFTRIQWLELSYKLTLCRPIVILGKMLDSDVSGEGLGFFSFGIGKSSKWSQTNTLCLLHLETQVSALSETRCCS